jgi:hypothetical protein
MQNGAEVKVSNGAEHLKKGATVAFRNCRSDVVQTSQRLGIDKFGKVSLEDKS